jgi:uncharacterized protein YoxC
MIEPAYVTREEFEARMAALEDEVEGEKTVTRHILAQTRHNSDDLATIKSRLDRVEDRLDGLDRKVDALDRKVDALDRKVDGIDHGLKGLARSMPGIVAAAMREVERERHEREGG